MKALLKKYLNRFVEGRLSPIRSDLERQSRMLRGLCDANFRTRASLKVRTGEKINLLFVCHSPALWGMFEPIYISAESSPDFHPTVVALPYKHPTLPAGQFKDDGVYDFLAAKSVNVHSGYDEQRNRWLAPSYFAPDYVFFQTPYDLFPPDWSVETVATLARVGYVPYGITISTGEQELIVQPERFLQHVHFLFMECSLKAEMLQRSYGHRPWFEPRKVIVSGSPKFDYLSSGATRNATIWKRSDQKALKRILWTPRWRTSEGTCHFFEYKDFFFDFCRKHSELDFAFRPHPLLFQNYVTTGEMSLDQQKQMRAQYAASLNMTIDDTPAYETTFLNTDILVSDFSSMMVEFFATGKPIVYTHRRNIFNEYGRRISEGFYWVRNAAELNDTLEMLLSNRDPLRERRRELMKDLIFMPQGGAGLRIRNFLRENFQNP